MLERLSVFAGGFDLDSAEALASPGSDAPVPDEVMALVDKSLVQWDETGDRYRLLETVRDYAAGKLLARGPETARAARAAHRDHYLTLAETAAPHLIGHGQMEWLDRLELEIDNLRAATSECNADSDPELGLRMAIALRYFWAYREPRVEGAHAISAALDRPDAKAPTLARGRAVVAAAHILTFVTDVYDAAAARCQEALVIARALPNEHVRAEAMCWLLLISTYQGDEDAHAALAHDAVCTARAVGDPHLTAQILMHASASSRVPHHERVRAFEESLLLARETGDGVLSARILGNLGYDALEAGDISSASAWLEEALRLARHTGDQAGLTLAACNLGFASYLDSADAAARALFHEALRTAQRNGDLHMVAHAQLGLALLADRAGHARRAAELHGTADSLLEKLGTHVVAVEARLREAAIARLRATLGDAAFELAYRAGRMTEASDELAVA